MKQFKEYYSKELARYENSEPYCTNKTEFSNKEWSAFFTSLGNALVDWCKDNGIDDVWKIDVTLNSDGTNESNAVWSKKDDLSTLINTETAKTWAETVRSFLEEFEKETNHKLPDDWTMFNFSLDGLWYSIEYGYWTPYSDGSLCMIGEGDDNVLVACL